MSNHLQIIPIPAFNDNYIWLIHDGQDGVVVDPGDHIPVLDYIIQRNITLKHCYITHHHNDHIGGVDPLMQHYPEMIVWASTHPTYHFNYHSITEPQVITLTLGETLLQFKVINVPGHTLSHVAFYEASQQWLFCGDTLFSAGCGRLFEGTPEQMLASLHKLCQLPDSTSVYCTHEYTEHNLKFARMLDVSNELLKSYQLKVQEMRKKNLPSLPSNIGLEKAINPFLRCHQMALKNAISQTDANELTTFTQIRLQRNDF